MIRYNATLAAASPTSGAFSGASSSAMSARAR
jgi:hypothetical protein